MPMFHSWAGCLNRLKIVKNTNPKSNFHWPVVLPQSTLLVIPLPIPSKVIDQIQSMMLYGIPHGKDKLPQPEICHLVAGVRHVEISGRQVIVTDVN